jgi:protein TonB
VSRQLTTGERFVALLPMLWPYALVAIGMFVIGWRTHRRSNGATIQRAKQSLREVAPIAISLILNFSLIASAVVVGGAEKKPELVEVDIVGLDTPEPTPPPQEILEPAPAADLAPSDLTADLASAPTPAFSAADFGEPDFSGPDGSGMGGLGPAGGDLGYGLGGGVGIGGGSGGSGGRQALIFESFQLDQAPRPVVKTPPTYPFKAREQGTEGVVQVKILVREDGGVGEVLIMDSRPKEIFDDAVLAAVPQWRFEPGVIDGKKVNAWVVTALRFELN